MSRPLANAPSSASNARLDTSPRGIKRSRSDEEPADTAADADADDNGAPTQPHTRQTRQH